MEKHDSRIDRLRLLACFGVVLLHSSTGKGIDDLALNALFRFSVPVFVLISGWFQLSTKISNKRLAKKCGLLFSKLLLWSGLYLVLRWILWNQWPQDILTWLLTEPDHLWYLYAIIGLNLMTPALYPFVQNAKKSEFHYALGLCFVIGCLGVTLVRLNWVPVLSVILEKSKLPDMLGFTFLYLLGGYFRRYGLNYRKSWLVLGLCCSSISILSAATPYNQQLLSFFSPNVVLSGGACFVLYMTRSEPAYWVRPFLRRAAECTTGIYLLHPLINNLVKFHLMSVIDGLFPSAYMLLSCLCTFGMCFAVMWFLTLYKPLKKYVL